MVGKFKLATLRVQGFCPRMIPGEEFEEFLSEDFMLYVLVESGPHGAIRISRER